MNEAHLDVSIIKRFPAPKQDFRLEVAFSVGEEIVVIFGPSGSGKTTILECISGLMPPDSGRITLHGRALFDTHGQVALPVRQRGIGYVFQTLALFPHMTAAQNVAYGLTRAAEKEREVLVREILQDFRISHVSGRRPSEMSGGERQRVALARSLVTKPRVLLLDEPLSALDYETKSGIMRDLREWQKMHRIPVIYVTHSVDEVFAIGDRVMGISAGKIAAAGKPEEILSAERDRLMKDLQEASR